MVHFAIKPPLRAARLEEVGQVQDMLARAVDELFDPQSEFAVAEKKRFHSAFLRGLMVANPGYVVIVETRERQAAGFIIGIPDMGHIVLSWGYILPEYRKGALAIRAFGEFARLWDNGKAHKIVYYALESNRRSKLIGEHAKFEKVAVLRRHYFGEDFVMYEKLYNKTQPGQLDLPVVRGRLGRFSSKMTRLLGLRRARQN